MEKMKTAKELRKEAEAIILGKVTNREQYELALKMVFETLERAKLLTDAAKAFKHQAERIGFKGTAIRAVFMGLADYAKENAGKGNITQVDGVTSIRNICRGPFEGLGGPWVKGKNMLVVAAVALDPFKSILSGIRPVNKTEGANPSIATVYDEVEGEYGVIVGTNLFSIAGADLGPDSEKADEYVAFVDGKGNEVAKAEITYSDLQNVKAHLETAIDPGEYTLTVYTRSGMGEEYGVKKATRKVTVK